MTLNTYLHYNGNCREAFEFYRSVFGGDFEILQTFADGPPGMGVSDDEANNIMHVSLRVGESILMGSDVPAAFGPPPNKGNNFSISYSAHSKQETDDLFAKLSQGRGLPPCRLRTCFGGPTLVPVLTGSALAGWSTASNSPSPPPRLFRPLVPFAFGVLHSYRIDKAVPYKQA